MNVLVPSLSGFCPGVRNAEREILRLREEHPRRQIVIPGYLINNRKYIEYLTSLDIHTLEPGDEIPPRALVVIRTHGINRHEEEVLRKKYEVVDLTCRNVKKVQTIIADYSEKGFCVLITGKKYHPEILGLESYGEYSHVIETAEDLDAFLSRGPESFPFPDKINKLLIISQTTGNRAFFHETVQRARDTWREGVIIESVDSICPVTDKKEEQALTLQEQCDVSFVIGDPLSSNARKLYRRLSANGKNVHFVEDLGMLLSLGLPLGEYSSALVVSSASTPVFIEQEVTQYLEKNP